MTKSIHNVAYRYMIVMPDIAVYMKISPTPVAESEDSTEIDDIENAKLQAREITLAILKKSTKWVIISFFVMVFAGCMYMWISSFKLT